jgi:1-phosphofructokinase
MKNPIPRRGVLTITTNPAIDQTVFVPGFTAGAVNRVREERRDVGGKGINVAAFLTHAGISSGVTGFLGADNVASFEAFFGERGLADTFVRLPGRTRTNLKIVDDQIGTITDVNFPGLTPTEDDVDKLIENVRWLAPSRRWVVISGSLPAGAPSDLYARLIDIARGGGADVALDASGEAMRLGAAALPTLIKPNIEELRELSGHRGDAHFDPRHAIDALHRRGIPLVAVSMGADGGLYSDRDQLVEAKTPQVPVVSTVGAGDAALAGLLAGMISGRSFVDCVRMATAFGAAAVTTVGPRLPSNDAIAELTAKVGIKVDTLS